MFYKFCSKISWITTCSFLYLVSLKREILLSNVALVMIRLTIFPLALTPHIYSRVWEIIHTRGISVESSAWNSSLTRLLGVTEWSCCLTRDNSQLPTSLVLTHWKRQWGISAVIGLGQYLQWLGVLGRILDSLSSVGRMRWSSFQRKLVASDPSPFNLALLQEHSQSVAGEASSALVLMYSMWLSAASIMVMFCSTKTLYSIVPLLLSTPAIHSRKIVSVHTWQNHVLRKESQLLQHLA